MAASSWSGYAWILVLALVIVSLYALARRSQGKGKPGDPLTRTGASDAASSDPVRVSGAANAMTIRRLEVAQKFPQEPPENPQLARGKSHTCDKDGATLQPILVTTYGPMGVKEVWRAYPLALEAWKCPKCQDILYPAFLEPEEATKLVKEGAEAGRIGQLDAAEFALRRVVSSWGNFSSARVNLGSVYLDRARQAVKDGAPEEDIVKLGKVAIAQFEKSLTCEPPPGIQVRFMLGKAYLRLGDTAKGRLHLEAYLASSDAQEPFTTEARQALAQ